MSSSKENQKKGPTFIFNGQNFHQWKSRMIMHLEAIEVESKDGKQFLNLAEIVTKPLPPESAQTRLWKKADKACRVELADHLAEDQFETVSDQCKNAKAMWEALIQKNERKTIMSKRVLFKRLMCLKMDESGDLDVHIRAFDSLMKSMRMAGIEFENAYWCCFFLSSLPASFDQVTTTLETINDDLPLDEVKNKVQDFYTKIKDQPNRTAMVTTVQPERKCQRKFKRGRRGKIPDFTRNSTASAPSGNSATPATFEQPTHGNFRNSRGYSTRRHSRSRSRRGRGNFRHPGYYSSYGYGFMQPQQNLPQFGQLTYPHHSHQQSQIKGSQNNEAQFVSTSGYPMLQNSIQVPMSNYVEREHFAMEVNQVNNNMQVSFYVDSGCTDHLSNNNKIFDNLTKLSTPIRLHVAKNTVGLVANYTGTVLAKSNKNIPFTIHNVLLVPDGRHNLLSVKVLDSLSFFF